MNALEKLPPSKTPIREALAPIIGRIIFWAFVAMIPGIGLFTDARIAASEDEDLAKSTCLRCHEGDRVELPSIQQPLCQECHAQNPTTVPPTVSSLPVQAGNLSSGMTSPGSDPVRIRDLPIVEQKMVLIPAGEFTMGNDGRGTVDGPGDPDEIPSHKVRVDSFFIDIYETTNAMYEAFVKATNHRTPRHWTGNTFPPGKANHPVVYVDWHDADTFCQWAGKRLPTEQEWEKAARGADGRIFPWGNTFSNENANTPQYWLAKGADEGSLGLRGGTLPVGSFEDGRSPYGLYDMAGNVYEWTSSWYLPYDGNRVWNIHYGQKNKVLRGGSWYDCLSYGCGLSAPVYNRSRFAPEIRNMGFGFRCAKSIKP